MCGIVGYVGRKQAAPILLDGLSKLEYRGYDSAGLAVLGDNDKVEVVKTKGRLKQLAEKTNDGEALLGHCGIGHTRWATHGEPSETNAHPHVSSGSASDEHPDVVGVHNGIIENFQEMKVKLTRHKYTFYSQTDTEVLVKLVDYYYKKYKIGPIDALAKTIVRVRGSYALAVMFKDYPGEIYVARKDSPMIIGVNDHESYIASDVPAILKHTRNVYYIGNLEMARLKEGEVTFFNLDGDVVEKQITEIKWDAEAAEKGGFEHFMMKEIHEQPQVVNDTLSKYLQNDGIDLYTTGLTDQEIRDISQVYIVACGSAWHVGMVAQYVIEDFTDLQVRVELASEFRYRKMHLKASDLVVIISQSGETADSLAALREAKSHGAKTLAVVNVVGSSIAREADYVMYTLAGPEIAVATTKAYSTQLICSYLIALKFASVRGTLKQAAGDRLSEILDVCRNLGLDSGIQREASGTESAPAEEKEKISDADITEKGEEKNGENISDEYTERMLLAYYIHELKSIPEKISRILSDKERLQWFASKYANARDAFFIGRGLDYAISQEGSLKMKEVSYIHSEAYAAGELKHGTISLIEDGTLVIGVLTQHNLYEKTVSNMVECKSRGAYLMGLTSYGHYAIEDQVDFTVYVPQVDEHFIGSLAVIPLQLLGYYTSVSKGLDVDKPRNLAKSVTVE